MVFMPRPRKTTMKQLLMPNRRLLSESTAQCISLVHLRSTENTADHQVSIAPFFLRARNVERLLCFGVYAMLIEWSTQSSRRQGEVRS
jgi:hypothetical protein